MEIIKYDKETLNKYLNDLQMVGMISSLFSDSTTPMLYYRATENLFCNATGATNLARSDVPADAKLGKVGIGIKTFLEQNKKTYQKIEEFNSQHALYGDLEPNDKIIKIAELRNKRLNFTKNTFDIESLIFHCIVRNKEGFHFFEEPMNLIDIEKIKVQSINKNTIDFTDGKANYKFNITKSTLYKQFVTDEYFAHVNVVIANDPLALIQKPEIQSLITISEKESLIMPLYSISHNEKFIPLKSGLNQWNAGGRKRNSNEVYIPFPAKLREENPNFFPSRNECFDVKLPSGYIISMKVCQDDGKAIMSNPNKKLGEWLLREVLELEENELLTYDKLLELGIDSVEFEKTGNEYSINFKEIYDDDSTIEENN